MSEQTKLDRIVEEARSDHAPGRVADLDWDAMEASLMARTANEPRRRSRRAYVAGGIVAALAVAAGAVFFVRERSDDAIAQQAAKPPPVTPAPLRAEASALKSGNLRVGDQPAPAGYVLREGDDIQVLGGRAELERPNAVSWLLDADDGAAARAHVSSAGRPLVLALEHGAIEAQVTPVKTGEAFAVDVATKNGVVRVAVHGTHLRVYRTGDHVAVDLSEGVIAIGVPPASGVTTGTTVTAPAHVELDATDLGSIQVDHAVAHVRPPVQLGDHVVVMAEPPPAAEPVASAATPKPALKVDAPKPAPRAGRELILTAVRQCALRNATPSAVRVTVTSDLSLQVSDDGHVQKAVFNPPLPPDIQTCAAETIYKTKLDETGAVELPIEFSY